MLIFLAASETEQWVQAHKYQYTTKITGSKFKKWVIELVKQEESDSYQTFLRMFFRPKTESNDSWIWIQVQAIVTKVEP